MPTDEESYEACQTITPIFTFKPVFEYRKDTGYWSIQWLGFKINSSTSLRFNFHVEFGICMVYVLLSVPFIHFSFAVASSKLIWMECKLERRFYKNSPEYKNRKLNKAMENLGFKIK